MFFIRVEWFCGLRRYIRIESLPPQTSLGAPSDALINIGLVRLFTPQWPKFDRRQPNSS